MPYGTVAHGREQLACTVHSQGEKNWKKEDRQWFSVKKVVK
jgi:hypothetical protein